MSVPESRFFQSQGLRLHYADWGNEDAPLMLLVHGGRDHCRSWDLIARSLQPHFHVVAPDLRGHGNSDWTKGGSYSLTEYVYDLSRLVRSTAADQVTMVGHSMGGMVGLIYAGTFPEQVSALVVLDGVTVLPNAKRAPAHERIAKYVGQLDKLEDREPRRYRTIEEAAAQMRAHNTRLSSELAQHLATFGVRRNEDDTYSWKFDPYQRSMAPHRLSGGRSRFALVAHHLPDAAAARGGELPRKPRNCRIGRLFPASPHRNHFRRGALAASRQA